MIFQGRDGMIFNFEDISLRFTDPAAEKAARLFADEIKLRTNVGAFAPEGRIVFDFVIKDKSDNESFTVQQTENGIIFTAHRLRGLIYAYSLFLRRSVFNGSFAETSEEIFGTFSPEKKIRGHQIGYRAINNTYDKWTEKEYKRYFLDLMMFGMNIYEGIPGGKEEMRAPMTMTGDEMLIKTSAVCDELDLDVSVWAPTGYGETDEQIICKIHDVYFKMKKLDVLFIPGGDPGDMKPADLFARCKMIKNEFDFYGKNISIWVSAQAPHDQPDWGKDFLSQLEDRPDYIDGIIFGPNHAMSLPALYDALHGDYPIRFYPDVTHSVRCEYPVHFEKNDWHYAFACCFGRESADPRPLEYKHLYDITKDYLCGSVSYSDGIHDDVNKVIFSALDFDSSQGTQTILNDYARAFFYKTDYKKITDLILSLEKNWEGDPAENDGIFSTYNKAVSLLKSCPELKNNFRFVMLLFRAECDLLIKTRFEKETAIVKKAKQKILENDITSAKEILLADLDEDYKNLRKKTDDHAAALYDLIGMQLDVARFGGTHWERGCTLESIDRPITDRQYLLGKISRGYDAEELKRIISRCDVQDGEIYFSFCTDGMGKIDRQTDDFYLDFRGDRPENDGSIPVALLNLYDHYDFRYTCRLKADIDRVLKVTFKERPFEKSAALSVKLNGNVIYNGAPYGGTADLKEDDLLPDGYVQARYVLPKELLKDGNNIIEISERSRGVLIAELFIVGDEKNE